MSSCGVVASLAGLGPVDQPSWPLRAVGVGLVQER